jgi:SAM-dependent methyltransferase
VALYDTLGLTYSSTRQADPRIAATIDAALSDAATIVNIGAGTGSYEPPQTLMAIEPSQVMIDQRPTESAPAIRAVAEHLPLRDKCVDAALAVLTIHHWTDLEAGVAEMQRVARTRLAFFTCDNTLFDAFWLLSDYLPEAAAMDAQNVIANDRLLALLTEPVVTPVPVPHDCQDGFGAAYWRRPEAYLDPAVRAGISLLSRNEEANKPGLARLAADLESGRWEREHAELLDRDELDLGYCLITSAA